MRPQERATARRQLDKRLAPLREAEALTQPPRGWIKAIREALGMTTAQLGRRLGVSQPRAVVIEKAEVSGSISLASLERAAQALDCRLVYALVPRAPLDDLVKERAHLLAKRKLEAVGHSMTLEAQGVDADNEREQLISLAQKLAAKSGSELWEEP